MMIGGIDLGGSKIEARLFDGPEAITRTRHRIPTPAMDYAALVEALVAQVRWLETQAGTALPVGVALPGIIDPASGICTAANVPVTGRTLAADLAARLGRTLPLLNDATAFALSEARGGAAEGSPSAVGVILGTGLSAGYTLGGAPAPRASGLAVELGHIGLSARALSRHALPLLRCGCGRLGCLERYLSGPGLRALSIDVTGQDRSAEEIAEAAISGETDAQHVLDIWADLAGEMLDMLHLMLDPAVIVLGGGLSNLPGVTERLAAAHATHRLGDTRLPDLRLAEHGDSSGARGAALWARDQIAEPGA